MAETIVSAIVGDVVNRVISHLIGHYCRHQQQSTEAKLQMIRHKLVRIHSAVEEAKGKQIVNDGTLQWLSELIVAEYQGNYLLDCIKHEDGEDDEGTVVSTLSQFNPAKRARISVRNILPRRRDLTIDEIDRVAERLQGVCDGLSEFIMLLGTCQPIRRPLATNIFRHGQMFGRHVEKERIISFLLHDDDDDTRLAVLPVVGDTGVGKTTLVQHACDDARVRSHFEVIMLLDFSYTSAAAAATARSETNFVLWPKHVIGDAGVDVNVNGLVDLVKLDFSSKRFLLVFEDVDTRKKQVLEDLLHGSSTSSKQRSKIIVTTNNRLVGTIGTVKPIMLKALPFPEYWFFFRAHAFSGRDLEESPRLVAAGKAIAKKLDGSFFGAKIVGGLLMNNPNPGFWRWVSGSSGIEDMSALGDGVNYVMDLSQSLLPGNVRMCQVIVSKDHRFSQTELGGLHGASAAQITRWAWAQGYGFARVLLCESLLPFYNLYYIAECTAGLVNGYSESEVARYLASV